MKPIFIQIQKVHLILLITIFVSISISAQSDEFLELKKQSNLDIFYQNKLVYLDSIDTSMKSDSLDLKIKMVSEPNVSLLSELIHLFDPNNFKCGYDLKFKRKIKKFINDNNTEGFVPSIVLNKIDNQMVSKLSDKGVNVAANSFKYKSKTTESKLIFARFSPTALNFNQEDYFERNNQTYSSFFYSLDCSGYLSNALSASAGFDKATLKSAANSSSNANNSLVILKGVMYSPLYLAYQGNGIFKSKSKEYLEKRREVLVQIIQSIPNIDRTEETVIYLDSNYLLLFTSNSGKTSFNGEASLSASGGVGFGFGTFSVETSVSGKINKTTEFYDYDTYILDVNVNSSPDLVTVGSLEKIIDQISKDLSKLSKN